MKDTQNWISPDQSLLPDFIIGGAMKSGTSTLHRILQSHPEIFIPESEVHFFDIDNILEHSDFNSFNKKSKNWYYQSMKKDPQILWNWYLDKFKGKKKLIKGEDSTTYLSSGVVAKRLSLQEKSIKLIFILRNPTERAYSNYWHLLRSGRAIYNFEDLLQYNPNSVLKRSLYKDQLQCYYDLLPRERIKVILFEDLVANPKEIISDISNFLGIDFVLFPEKSFDVHSNKGTLPRNIQLQILKNRIFRNWGNSHYNDNLPIRLRNENKSIIGFVSTVFHKVYSRINPSNRVDIPLMVEGTKCFLDNYFIKELDGIDELIGKEVLQKWFNT